MSDPFKIWIDRLKDGKIQKISEALSPDFLDIQESELQCVDPVIIEGESYLADDHLILNLMAKTLVKMPCAICNEMIPVEIKIHNFYHAEPIEQIKDAIFDFSLFLREALLIEVPKYAECLLGRCVQRDILKPYMKKNIGPDSNVHFPFSHLES